MQGDTKPTPDGFVDVTRLLNTLQMREAEERANREREQRQNHLRDQLERALRDLYPLFAHDLFLDGKTGQGQPAPDPHAWDRVLESLSEVLGVARQLGLIDQWRAVVRPRLEAAVGQSGTAIPEQAADLVRAGCDLFDLAEQGQLTADVLRRIWEIGETGRAAVGHALMIPSLLATTLPPSRGPDPDRGGPSDDDWTTPPPAGGTTAAEGGARAGSGARTDEQQFPAAKKRGRRRVEEANPVLFQIYERVVREASPGENRADVVDRLKADRQFCEQVVEAGLKLDTKLVRRALAFFDQRKKRQSEPAE